MTKNVCTHYYKFKFMECIVLSEWLLIAQGIYVMHAVSSLASLQIYGKTLASFPGSLFALTKNKNRVRGEPGNDARKM